MVLRTAARGNALVSWLRAVCGVLPGVALVMALAVSLAAIALPTPAAARAAHPAPAPGEVPVAELPPQARHTLALIHQGGPFAYRRDGVTFLNREGRLPEQPRGYYSEYTVKTPGSRDRGARRIICGGTPPQSPEACFYTEDHYASFRRIVQ